MQMETIYQPIQLDPDLNTVEAIAKASDLDWEIVKKPSLYYDDNGVLQTSRKRILFLRKDGQLTELETVGGDNKPLQPKQLISVYISLCSTLDLELVTAGHTREGKHVYFIAKRKDSEKISGTNYVKCLLFTTSNDSNGKTKIRPICFNVETGAQLSQSRSAKEKAWEYSLSHHYNFDLHEATTAIQDKLGIWDAYFLDVEELGCIPASKTERDDFIHRIYSRFAIGNKSTIRKFEIVESELREAFSAVSTALPKQVRGSLLELYLGFCQYIDHSKKRKGHLSSKIHSINFANDEITKRTAFYTLKEIATELRN